MELIRVDKTDGLATVVMVRGKVHAFNEAMIDTVASAFGKLRDDPDARVIVLTGEGSFFSFGLDVPEIYGYSKEDFARFLGKFTALYTDIFAFPKPVIAAINGHAIAGGCMLTNACDYRVMVTGKARIALNEVTFGSSIFAGSVEILQALVGNRNAETVAFTGKMFSAEEALALGLVDRAVGPEALASAVQEVAQEYLQRDLRAYAAIKRLLREPILEQMQRHERDSIRRFIDLWYSPETREKLKGIQIR